MGTYKRLPRGKTKTGVEFKDWTMHALEWVGHNWQVILEVAGVAAVAMAIWIGANSYWQHRSGAAAEELFKISLLEPGSDKRVEGLQKIISNYSRTPAGQQAMMQLGEIYMEKKEYDKAADEFKKLAGRSRNRPILVIAAINRMGEALMAEEKWTEASEAFLKAASDPKNLLSNSSRYYAAIALEKAGDYERAGGIYKQIVSDPENSDMPVKSACEERLIWLKINNLFNG